MGVEVGMKTNPLLPVFFASSIGLAQVVGSHEAHLEPNLQQPAPQLVGVIVTSAVTTATANVILGGSGWRNFE
jgi:hypothetical protein